MSEPGHNISSGARNLIERSFNKIKQSRRVATRYDKGNRPGILAGIESCIDPDHGGGEAEDVRNLSGRLSAAPAG